MKIEDNVGNITIKLGEPSENHIRLTDTNDYDYDKKDPTIEFHISQWDELKKKIDKMFIVAGRIKEL